MLMEPSQSKPLRTLLLVFPDNPMGNLFLTTFLAKSVPLIGILVETKTTGTNWRRVRIKIRKDGVRSTFRRMVQMAVLKIHRRHAIGIAERYGIPVYKVKRFNSQECADCIAGLSVDLLAIASAPILKPTVFEKARIGCLNAHPGWLPRYRGVGANRAAILNGEPPGVSIHFIDADIDTGRLIIREHLPVFMGDDLAKINDRAACRGAELMAEVIHRIQDESLTLPEISEPVGPCYAAGQYRDLRTIRRNIRNLAKKEIHAIPPGIAR
jgi:methionyl-tRNA formyltransferase